IPGLVRCKMLQGDSNGAIQIAKDQLRRAPDNENNRRLLVNTEFASGRFDDALADFQPIVLRDPSSASYLQLGEMQRQAKQYDAALANFKKAQQLVPNDPVPLMEMA